MNTRERVEVWNRAWNIIDENIEYRLEVTSLVEEAIVSTIRKSFSSELRKYRNIYPIYPKSDTAIYSVDIGSSVLGVFDAVSFITMLEEKIVLPSKVIPLFI